MWWRVAVAHKNRVTFLTFDSEWSAEYTMSQLKRFGYSCSKSKVFPI